MRILGDTSVIICACNNHSLLPVRVAVNQRLPVVVLFPEVIRKSTA